MPTMTFNVAASADDGSATGIVATAYPPPAATSNVTETSTQVKRSVATSIYTVTVGLLRWNTATLPAGATITSATLRIQLGSKAVTDGRSLVAEWYAASNWPIDTGDYTTTAPTTPAATLAISSITNAALNDLVFTDLSGINPTGYTGVRLQISGGQPTGNNQVNFSTFDHATDPEPQLIITYTLLVQLSGDTQGAATTTASLKHVVHLTGALVDAVNLIATLYIDKHVFGVLTGFGLANGGLKVGHLISGNATGAATDMANLEVGHLISGNVTGAATTTASITVTHHLSEALMGAATATASIQVGHTIAGIATGAVDSTGSLHVSHFLVGETDGSAVVTANLRVGPIRLSGAITATGRTAARLLGTFSVTASDDDGWVNPILVDTTGDILRVQRGGGAFVIVTLIRFDTSAMPDNVTITGAYLRLRVRNVTNTGVSNSVWYVTGEYYAASNWPIDAADWTDTAPPSPLFSVTRQTIQNAFSVGSRFVDIPLPSFSGISLTGYSGFRLHLQGAETGATFGADFESSDTNSNGPMLVVNFTTFKPLSGTTIGTATATGQLDKSAYLITGVATGQGVLSASLQLTAHLTGEATGLASLQASVAITTHLDGTANGEATINAMLNRTIAMVASADGAATANAGLSVTHHLQGAPIGQGVAGGLLSIPMFIGGALRGTGVLLASISHVVHVDAVVPASATAVATPQVFKNMVGSLVGQALVTANLRISHVRMEGVITGQAVLTGSLRIAHRMQGFTIGTATAQATMGPVNHINGIVTGTAVSVVVLRHIVHARGLVYGQAFTSALLMWVHIQTIHCEPLTGVHDAPGCTGLSPVATISKENLVTLHTIGK